MLPKQVPTWLGMCVIVAFSSSLDVAAIEMQLGQPLDYNWCSTYTSSICLLYTVIAFII